MAILRDFGRNRCMCLMGAPHPKIFRPAKSNDPRLHPAQISQRNSKNFRRYVHLNFGTCTYPILGANIVKTVFCENTVFTMFAPKIGYVRVPKFKCTYLLKFLELRWDICAGFSLGSLFLVCQKLWGGAHPEISAKITENGHFRPKIENPQMCLLGAYNAPQNLAQKSM